MNNKKGIKAYKVFNQDWTCKNFKFEIGKTYSIKGELKMCENGFHACKKINNCFNYYDFNPKNKVAEVLLLGNVLGIDEDKQCCETIKIVKPIFLNSSISRWIKVCDNAGSW